MKLTKRIDLEIGKTQVIAGLVTAATIISVVGILVTRNLRTKQWHGKPTPKT